MMNENETITPGGAGESGQKKANARIDDSCQRMLELLQDVEGMAEKALADEPTGLFDCWRHFSKALSDIRKALRPRYLRRV